MHYTYVRCNIRVNLHSCTYPQSESPISGIEPRLDGPIVELKDGDGGPAEVSVCVGILEADDDDDDDDDDDEEEDEEVEVEKISNDPSSSSSAFISFCIYGTNTYDIVLL